MTNLYIGALLCACALVVGCEPETSTCKEKVDLALMVCCYGKCPMQEQDATYLDGLDSCLYAAQQCDPMYIECVWTPEPDKYVSSYESGCTIECECVQ